MDGWARLRLVAPQAAPCLASYPYFHEIQSKMTAHAGGTPRVLGRARHIAEAWRAKEARVKEPAKEWNEKRHRPKNLLRDSCAAVNPPHASDEACAYPKAEGADPQSRHRMQRNPID
jgi:hypothetical protein